MATAEAAGRAVQPRAGRSRRPGAASGCSPARSTSRPPAGLVCQRLGALRPRRRAARRLPQDPPLRRDVGRRALPGVRGGGAGRGDRHGRGRHGGRRARPARPVHLLRPALPGPLQRRSRCAARAILCVPSAFTAHTGAAHWEVLLRARAIENGCFVVAPDQVGEHLPGRDCFGHSMIVDPWGTVLARVEEGVGICVADLDLARLDEVRGQIPSLRAPAPGRLRPLTAARAWPRRRGCRCLQQAAPGEVRPAPANRQVSPPCASDERGLDVRVVIRRLATCASCRLAGHVPCAAAAGEHVAKPPSSSGSEDGVRGRAATRVW